MRSEEVVTNLTCNQACTYCTRRSAAEVPAFVAPRAVQRRIESAVRAGAEEIVLTGGEPTLRRDLPALVAHSRSAGAKQVVLETNAATITTERAIALAAAGLAVARVNLSGASSALDAVTRDEGGFDATFAGVEALARASITIELSAVLVRSTVSLVRDLGALAGRLGARTVRVRVPHESPDPSELLDYKDVVEAILALRSDAEGHGVEVRLAPDSGPPPCVFPPHKKSERLFSLTPGASRRARHASVPACASCVVRDRCSGFPEAYLARFGAPESLSPPRDDRARRRLSIAVSVAAQIERELVEPSLNVGPGVQLEERLIRVNFHCNQACRFCFVSTHLPAAEEARVQRAIEEAGAAGARIVLTGGEPTLNARLADYVRLAKRVSRQPVGLQTNATLLDDPRRVEELARAGLDDAFVSLHAPTAELSDAITEAPGTFARTVVGIDNLVKARIAVVLNFVIHRKNQGELTRHLRMVSGRWPSVPVNLSFVAPATDVVPQDAQMVPRYSEVIPELAAALSEAEALGMSVGGFESMCGIPLCLVPAQLARYFLFPELPRGVDRGEFLKVEACSRCALSERCFGIRRRYAELYGTAELSPVDELGQRTS